MRRLIFTLFLYLLMLTTSAAAADIDINGTAAVMDFGTRPGATSHEINIHNAEYTSSEYILNGLLNKNCFDLKDKTMVFDYLKQNGIKTTGLIDPDSAKAIGHKLGVRYLVYGNVAGVTTSSTGTELLAGIGAGVHVCTVKSTIVARVMDVETGTILAVVRGEGSSKSSFTALGARASGAQIVTLVIGNKKVTMDSVHNAIQKAAFNVAENLTNSIKGIKGKGKK